MSSTDTLEQPRPFDRLPNELLTKILLYLAPPTISIEFDSDLDEKNPLFNVRLVSKQLHAVCAPILHRDLEIGALADSMSDLNQLVSKVQASPERRAACRKLEVARCPMDGGRISLRRWAQLLPNVERLRVCWRVDEVNFDHIAKFTSASLFFCRMSTSLKAS